MAIYTIGYQGMSIEELGEAMARYDIDRLIDVRSKPYSRNTSFNRNRLIESLGASYLWKGDVLGGFAKIKDDAIEWLAAQEDNVLVMCMERHPCDCHRQTEIGLRLLGLGVDAVHLFEGQALHTERLKEICDERHKERNRRASARKRVRKPGPAA
jgi:uncharacterized protein (DUF488 family)